MTTAEDGLEAIVGASRHRDHDTLGRVSVSIWRVLLGRRLVLLTYLAGCASASHGHFAYLLTMDVSLDQRSIPKTKILAPLPLLGYRSPIRLRPSMNERVPRNSREAASHGTQLPFNRRLLHHVLLEDLSSPVIVPQFEYLLFKAKLVYFVNLLGVFVEDLLMHDCSEPELEHSVARLLSEADLNHLTLGPQILLHACPLLEHAE